MRESAHRAAALSLILLRTSVIAIDLALRVHLAQSGGVPRRLGGLSPQRERQAKLLLLASIHDRRKLEEVHSELGLSRSHFIRAFQQSVGETPYRWLTVQKIEKAQRLMRESGQPLTEIALACGFCDQAHFTRTFSRVSGTTPRAWRHNRQ